MNRLISTVTIILLSANCQALQAQEAEILQQWKAGETVSAADVEQFGEARCFEPVEIPNNILE